MTIVLDRQTYVVDYKAAQAVLVEPLPDNDHLRM